MIWEDKIHWAPKKILGPSPQKWGPKLTLKFQLFTKKSNLRPQNDPFQHFLVIFIFGHIRSLHPTGLISKTQNILYHTIPKNVKIGKKQKIN